MKMLHLMRKNMDQIKIMGETFESNNEKYGSNKKSEKKEGKE